MAKIDRPLAMRPGKTRCPGEAQFIFCNEGYYYDTVHRMCVRTDYDPRADYSDELDKVIRILHATTLENL